MSRTYSIPRDNRIQFTFARTYWRGCVNKRRFTAKSHARAEARRMIRQGLATGTMTTYKCKSCHGWHNGNH